MRYTITVLASLLCSLALLQAQPETKKKIDEIEKKIKEIEEKNPDLVEENRPKVEENRPKVEENRPKVEENRPKVEENRPKVEENRPKLATSANLHAILAHNFLKKVKKDAPYIRFLSFYNYADRPALLDRVKTQSFWINNLHFEAAPTLPREVPGSGGLLYYIHLQDYGWSSESFSVVARREPYFRDDRGISSGLAVVIRDLIGVPQKGHHVEAIVRADWFFRETMESDRSKSYYDLLFSKFQNQVAKVTRTRTRYERRQVLVDYGSYRQYEYREMPVQETYEEEVKGGRGFPKNETDFEKAFGVDTARKFTKDFKINTQHGAVVEGGEKGVSFVARQNRLVERTLGTIGSYYKTYDVKETTGRRDFAETLQRDFEFDAGEILADLPAGGMAALLVDSKGKIVETADNRFASDNSDLKYDSRVRTPGSCFICHEKRYIKPKDLVREMLEAGVDVKVKGKKQTLDTRAFFMRWERKLVADQSLFEGLIEETSGFKPGVNASKLKEWRDEYDAPVSLKTALAETGLLKGEFEYLANKSKKLRMKMLVRGLTIPRKTWEVDTFPETMQLNEEYH